MMRGMENWPKEKNNKEKKGQEGCVCRAVLKIWTEGLHIQKN